LLQSQKHRCLLTLKDDCSRKKNLDSALATSTMKCTIPITVQDFLHDIASVSMSKDRLRIDSLLKLNQHSNIEADVLAHICCRITVSKLIGFPHVLCHVSIFPLLDEALSSLDSYHCSSFTPQAYTHDRRSCYTPPPPSTKYQAQKTSKWVLLHTPGHPLPSRQ